MLRSVFKDRLSVFGLNKKRIAVFFLLAFAAAIFEGFGMAMFLPLIEYVEHGQNAYLLRDTSTFWEYAVLAFEYFRLKVTLALLLFIVLALFSFRVVLVYLRNVYFAWVAQEIKHNARCNLFRSYCGASYRLFDSFTTGAVINLTTTEVERFGSSIYSVFIIVSDIVMIMGYVIVLLWISVHLTFLAVSFLAIGGLITLWLIRYTKEVSYSTTKWNKAFATILVERLSCMKLLKLTGTVERELKTVTDASEKVRSRFVRLRRLSATIDLVFEPVIILCVIVMFYLAVNRLGLSVASIGLFILIMLRLLPLSKGVLHDRQSYESCRGSVAAVLQTFEQVEEASEKNEGVRPFVGIVKGIAFNSVTYTYPGRTNPVLKGVDCLFPANKMTALVGPSGTGKSTMMDMLSGLRQPQQGKVCLDEFPVHTYELQSLRRGMGFVTQEEFIFNDSIFRNVTLSRPQASKEEVWEALDKAKIAEFVRSLPDGLNTVVGERGARLSGGQKQLLSLSRALIQSVSVLVFDEPTSALDSGVEKDIKKTMLDLVKEGQTTIIVIAHRLSTVRDADKIVVLWDGKIVEEGAHDELMGLRQWYFRMSKLQTLDAGEEI